MDFLLTIYIWPWPIQKIIVKVVKILTANRLEMVAVELDVMYGLSVNIFAFDLDSFHRLRLSSCTILTVNIFEIVADRPIVTIAFKRKLRHGILISIFRFDFDPSNGMRYDIVHRIFSKLSTKFKYVSVFYYSTLLRSDMLL